MRDFRVNLSYGADLSGARILTDATLNLANLTGAKPHRD